MPLTAQEQKDQKLWYSTREVDLLVASGLKDHPGTQMIRCETRLDKLSAAIREFDRSNPDNNNLAIPFLLEGAGGRNHFYTIFREKTPDGTKFIIQDSNGQEAPERLKQALTRANPGATIESWNIHQQNNNFDCGPHVVNNLTEMAAAKTADPSASLTANALSIQSPKGMSDIRASHGKILDANGIATEGTAAERRKARKNQDPATEAMLEAIQYVFETVEPALVGILNPQKATPFFMLPFIVADLVEPLVSSGEDKSSKEPGALAAISGKHPKDKKTDHQLKLQQQAERAEADAEGGCSMSGGAGPVEKQPKSNSISAVDISGIKIPAGVTAVADAQGIKGGFAQRYKATQEQQKKQGASPAA